MQTKQKGTRLRAPRQTGRVHSTKKHTEQDLTTIVFLLLTHHAVVLKSHNIRILLITLQAIYQSKKKEKT